MKNINNPKMKLSILLLLPVLTVIANVCTDKSTEESPPLSWSFTIPGHTSCFLMDILEDNERGLLYFVGLMYTVMPWDIVIYKADFEMEEIKVVAYDIFATYYSYVIDPSWDFIYVQSTDAGKIVEIRATDLAITRELSVTSADLDFNSNLKVSSNFFLTLRISSIFHICRWGMVTTGLDWFTFGVNSPANFEPISSDLLFYGSVDVVADQYYLVNYNFSDSSNLVWKKSIGWPTSGWGSGFSNAILSRDEEWVYAMILYHDRFIFQKLGVALGDSQYSGLIWYNGGIGHSYSMKEFNDFVAIQIQSPMLAPDKRLILVNSTNVVIFKEFKSVNSRAYAVGRLLYQGQEIMYHAGRIDAENRFLFARSLPKDIARLQEFEEDTPIFAPITTIYQVSSTSSTPSIASSTRTLIISSTPSFTTNDITSTTNPSFSTYVALWDQEHVQSVQSSSLVLLEFTWAWFPPTNYISISFSLAQTGSNAIPEWVQLDAGKQELYLNTTPKLDKEETYYFSLQISFDTEMYYKKFEITVEEWTILNCALWKLGEPSIWETWIDGYQGSDGDKSWK